MTEQNNQPPKLRKNADGAIDNNSLADLIEWFLIYDPRAALVRNPQVEELFQWKQQDDKVNNIPIYPFENAEARFAVGIFQALEANDSETALQTWITEVVEALGESKQTNEQIAAVYKLEQSKSHVEESRKISSNIEKRLYLSSCWLESLCTAEARVLGWIYRELYGKSFEPLGE